MRKVLDYIIQTKHAAVLITSYRQFGFIAEHSTTECTYVMNKFIDFYVNQNTSCYSVLLDLSKVFGRVPYLKLLKPLICKGVCLAVAKLLLFMYTNQPLMVKWSGASECFSCSNGIKQGGVLSPDIFCVHLWMSFLKRTTEKMQILLRHFYMVQNKPDMTDIGQLLA